MLTFSNLQPILPQVPVICLCGRYFLLLCRNDFCCSWHIGTLQQNNAAVLHSSSGKLCLLLASAFPHHPLSQTPAPQVTHCLRCFSHSFMLILFSNCFHCYPFCLFPNVPANIRLNRDTGKLGMSYSKFKRKDLSSLGHLILKVKLSFSVLSYILLLCLYMLIVCSDKR